MARASRPTQTIPRQRRSGTITASLIRTESGFLRPARAYGGFMTRERLINRRQQGDLGEASAIEWLTSQRALVWTPFGHSPDVDLLAEIESRLLRVQAKTSTRRFYTSNRAERWEVQLATNGGNQSWTGETKKLDPARVDFVFVLVGDGRRWFIPAPALEGHTAITLGGPRYSEFEIDRGSQIECLVYGDHRTGPTIEDPARGSADVGESGETVNLVLLAEWVRIPPPPSAPTGPPPLGISQTRISANRQVTVPRRSFETADLAVGDRMRVIPDGEGRVVLERIEALSQERLALDST